MCCFIRPTVNTMHDPTCVTSTYCTCHMIVSSIGVLRGGQGGLAPPLKLVKV